MTAFAPDFALYPLDQFPHIGIGRTRLAVFTLSFPSVPLQIASLKYQPAPSVKNAQGFELQYKITLSKNFQFIIQAIANNHSSTLWIYALIQGQKSA
jgi:hypothetical protein